MLKVYPFQRACEWAAAKKKLLVVISEEGVIDAYAISEAHEHYTVWQDEDVSRSVSVSVTVQTCFALSPSLSMLLHSNSYLFASAEAKK